MRRARSAPAIAARPLPASPSAQADHWADDFQASRREIPAGRRGAGSCRWSFGNAAGLDQHDRVDGQFVLGGDVAANGLEHRLQFALLPPLDFVNDHQPLAGRRLRR